MPIARRPTLLRADLDYADLAPPSEEPTDSTAREMVRMLTGYWLSRALYTAAKLGLADAIEELGGGAAAVPVDQIARRLQLNPSALHRLLRALAGANVFRQEGEHGSWRYALNPLAHHLLTESPWSLRNAALMYGEEMALAWHGLPAVIGDERPSWDAVLGATHFDYYQHNSAAAIIFDRAMQELGNAMYSDSQIAATYDFRNNLRPGATIVDVGGGLGRLLAAILQRNPTLRGVLHDLPHVVAHAQQLHECGQEAANSQAVHREYLSRLHFEAGNFFESVPANADAYIMKRVLHDWDDDRCRALLGNVSRAMTDTARVLIVETLVEPAADQFGKWLDLNMMVVTGGRERTSEEFADLLDSVGLRIVAVHQTPTLLKVVDVVRAVV